MNIYEKQMDEVERFMLYFMSAAVEQVSSLTSFSVNAITELCMKKENYKALLEQGGEATLKEFQKALKKGETFYSLRVEDYMCKDYYRFLNSNNVLYVSLNDTENGTHAFMFRERDLDKVKDVQNLVNTMHVGKSEIDPKMFMNIYEGKDIGLASNLTAEEVELTRYFIKPEKNLYSFVTDENGISTLLYDPKDRNAVQNAINCADWALRGAFGARVLQQIQYRIKGRQAIVQDLEDARKEFYIVSKNNPKNYVHVTENQISCYKNEQEISKVFRDDKNFMPVAWNMIEGISSPAILSSTEFSNDLYQRQLVLDQKMSLEEFPSEMIVEEEMLKYNKLRDLASYKMSMDNENQGDWALYVDSVPYTEYASREEMLDDDQSHVKNFTELKQSVKYSHKNHSYDEFVLEDKSLDAIISRAQDRVSGKEPQVYSKEYNR